MSGKLEELEQDSQKRMITQISELISGGSSLEGKELEAGDIIMKVAQGNKEAVDVIECILMM